MRERGVKIALIFFLTNLKKCSKKVRRVKYRNQISYHKNLPPQMKMLNSTYERRKIMREEDNQYEELMDMDTKRKSV